MFDVCTAVSWDPFLTGFGINTKECGQITMHQFVMRTITFHVKGLRSQQYYAMKTPCRKIGKGICTMHGTSLLEGEKSTSYSLRV